MSDRIVLTDDLLRRALERRMAHPAPPALLDRILAAATGSAQDRPIRRGWLGISVGTDSAGWQSRWRTPRLGLAGLAVAGIALILTVVSLRPVIDDPGSTRHTPAPTPTGAAGTLVPETPEPVAVGASDTLRLRLQDNADPIDVEAAFGSIWVAALSTDEVRRYDPATMAELARIPLRFDDGPAWFVEAGGALWVTNQVGIGVTRIDPTTNSVTDVLGSGSPCGEPVLLDGIIWQAACDSDLFMRIDPVERSVEELPAQGHLFLYLAGGRLITTGAQGLAELDPSTGAIEPVPFSVEGFRSVVAADDDALWVATDAGVERIDPVEGTSVATLPYVSPTAMTFVDRRAWLSVHLVGVVEIDLASNEVLRTIPILPSPLVASEAAGVLWVTDFENAYLWRVEL